MKSLFGVVLALALVAAGPARASEALLRRLQPQGHVNDFAGVFEPASRTALEQFLQGVQGQTGAEIAVVTLPSLEGGEINDFATRLFEKWGIGRKGKDDGVLLLMALEEREVRIEVGYGLEGALPDARAGRILDEAIIPRFKEGQYAAGLANGAAALAQIVAREAGISLPGAPPAGVTSTTLVAAASAAVGERSVGEIVFVIFFFGFIMALILLGRKFGWKGGSGSSGRSGVSGGSRFGGFSGGRSGGGGASRSW